MATRRETPRRAAATIPTIAPVVGPLLLGAAVGLGVTGTLVVPTSGGIRVLITVDLKTDWVVGAATGTTAALVVA